MESYQGGVSYEDAGDHFQKLSQTVSSNIKKISQNVTSMSKMVNQLQTPQDSQEIRNQLRQIQNYTQKLVKDTSTMLMELMKMPVDEPASKMTRDRLSDDFMTTLNSFQATQKLVAQKTKEDVKKVKSQHVVIPGPHGENNSGTRDLVEMGDTNNLKKQEQLTVQSERSLMELEERERDIRQLEHDIVDVNHIFKELGAIIIQQGAVVDSIESHVEYTAQSVESGAHQLREASNYKNKLRKKKVYLAIILVIVVSIILIIVFHN